MKIKEFLKEGFTVIVLSFIAGIIIVMYQTYIG